MTENNNTNSTQQDSSVFPALDELTERRRRLEELLRNARGRSEADDEDEEDEEEDVDTEDEEKDDEDSPLSAPRFHALMRALLDDHSSDDDDDDEDEDDDEDSRPSFFFGDDDDEDEDKAVNSKDADDYHNDAVDCARRNQFKKAVDICIKGISYFPDNADLLADVIKYSSKMGDLETADKYYHILSEKLPRSMWNWRAFTFSCDYLVLQPMANEQELRQLIEDYRTYLPFDEKCYMAESALETALGNHERSLQVLMDAVHNMANASQCSLRLADMLIERGRFSDVVDVCSYGLAASAEVQPSINIPYLYVLRALAKDALLHQNVSTGATVDEEAVDKLIAEYELILDSFPDTFHHKMTLNRRISMLKILKLNL